MTTPRKNPYELVFWGGSDGLRYRRWHKSLEEARATAWRVLAAMSDRGAHPAIIHGPGLGKDGISIF
jgi:hypothetical protein